MEQLINSHLMFTLLHTYNMMLFHTCYAVRLGFTLSVTAIIIIDHQIEEQSSAPLLHQVYYTGNIKFLWHLFLLFYIAIMRGDPHITTLDGYQYTFNGKGEFVLINTADDSFFLQARMVPIDNVVDNSIQATVFTAIAVRQNNSGTVQFEIVNNETIILINREEVDFMLIKEHEFANVSINDLGNSTYSASFSSGAYLEVKEENGIFSSLVVSLPKLFQEAGTSGLMGSFNGNQSDDLLPNSADVPLSLNSSLQDIHQLFGITCE